MIKNKWFVNTNVGLSKNTELGLDLRLSAGLAGGRNIIQTNSNLFKASVGVSPNREWAADDSANGYNVEGVVGLRYKKFRYIEPKHDLTVTWDVYPNLTDFGRVRSEFEIKSKWDIVKDLFWDLTYTDKRDNKPTTTGAAKSDCRIVFSLGWEF